MKFMMYLQLFAHAHQERWSSLVDKKLRQTLVTTLLHFLCCINMHLRI